MPTTNPRINVTLDDAQVKELVMLTESESKSVSMLARELILEALSRREDMLLSAVAQQRDTNKAKRVKHEDVWK